jgi:hypothetical protein
MKGPKPVCYACRRPFQRGQMRYSWFGLKSRQRFCKLCYFACIKYWEAAQILLNLPAKHRLDTVVPERD